MKTNFEKWRDSLTPELVQDMFSGYLNGDPCRHCPAIDFCGKKDGCRETFTAWANTKAERTTPRRMTEKELWKRMARMSYKELCAAFAPPSEAGNKEDKK